VKVIQRLEIIPKVAEVGVLTLDNTPQVSPEYEVPLCGLLLNEAQGCFFVPSCGERIEKRCKKTFVPARLVPSLAIGSVAMVGSVCF
jgi:hypothetical protein